MRDKIISLLALIILVSCGKNNNRDPVVNSSANNCYQREEAVALCIQLNTDVDSSNDSLSITEKCNLIYASINKCYDHPSKMAIQGKI